MNHTFSVCPHCKSINKISSDKALEGKAVCGKCQSPLKLHGLVSELSAHDLKRILEKSDLPVVVDFWASWCGPCRAYAPEFEKASKEKTNAVFVKINTETEQQLSAEMGIRGIPCTIIFQNGREIRRQSGAMQAEQLKSFIG